MKGWSQKVVTSLHSLKDADQDSRSFRCLDLKKQTSRDHAKRGGQPVPPRDGVATLTVDIKSLNHNSIYYLS